jgi:putative ABC transport system permease protein
MRARVYALLLTLCPPDFRRRFGDELCATARELDRDQPVGWRGLGGVVIDAVATVYAIRREMRAERPETVPRGRWRPFEGIGCDLRVALRSVGREPLVAACVIAALMLGIGANAAMFGLVNRLLVRGPSRVHDPARVVRLYVTAQPPGRRTVTTDTFGNVTYDLLRHDPKDFQALAAYTVDDVVATVAGDTREIHGGYASATLFPLLGATPSLGRFFDEAENRPDGAAPVVVLSDAVWRSWFGAAPDVLGRAVTIGSDRYEVIGVAPAGFTGPQLGPVDVWMPINRLGPRTAPAWQTTWNAEWLQIVARLRPDATFEQAGGEATAVFRAGYTGGRPYFASARLFVAPLTANEEGVEGPELTVLRWMTAVALMVLLIACANVANLLLARGLRRGREVAVRAALGAGRARLVRLLVVESMVLAFAGAAAGIVVAYLVGNVARTVVFSHVDWTGSPVDAGTLGAAAVLGVAVGLVVGIVPAWRATRPGLADSLRTGPRDGGGPRPRLRQVLTMVQAALSVVLLVGAGLFVMSLWHVRSLHLGIDPERVLVLDVTRSPLGQIANPAARDAERARRHATDAGALSQLRAIPGADRASLAVGLPFGYQFTVGVRVPGRESLPTLPSGVPGVSAVAPDYFATVGTRIVRGRAFGPSDRAGSEPVAIVNEIMARTLWPDQDPIGQCLMSGPDPTPCARIVGIAEDTFISSLREDARMHYYIPFGQEVGFGGTVLLVRAADPAAIAPAARRTLMNLDPTIRYVDAETIQQSIDPQTRSWRIGATVFLLSGLLAVLVTAVGIYSVTAYLVADRRHEIGVRVALGARPREVARLVIGSSLATAAVGIAIGSGGALAAGHLVEPLLFHESARDPVVYIFVGALLLAVTVAAGLPLSIRANRIDPLEALRAE